MSQSDEYGYDDYDDYGQDEYENYNMEEEKMMGGEIPLSKQVFFLSPILFLTHHYLEIHRFCYSQRH